MTSLRRMLLTLVFVLSVCLSVQCAEQSAESLMDRAVTSAEVRKSLIEEYEKSPESVSGDRLLATAISYAVANQILKSRPVYERYVEKHPDNARALRGLAGGYIIESRFNEAITHLRKAWSLGDLDSLSMLAGSYVKASRYSEMDDLIPSLIKHADSNPEIVGWLVAYAMNYKDPPDVKLVMKAFANLPDQSFLEREDTAQLLREVLARFGSAPELELAQLPILVKVIQGYESDPKKWPANRRIYAADAYNLTGQHAKGESIYREILKDDPDYIPALRGLGISLAYQRQFKEGIIPLRKAWDRGDKFSLPALTACSLGARNFDGMADLIPSLLQRRKEEMDSLNTIIMYSLAKRPADRELFFRAIEGFTDEQLLRSEEVTHNVILGLRRFGEEKRAEKLEKLKADQDRGKKA